MDTDRFDTLAKRLAAPTTRRTTLGAAAASGLLSTLGLNRTAPAARAAQERTCVLAFVATARLGPSVEQALARSGSRPDEVRGELRFALSETGNLEDGALLLPDGTSLPVVGQATGHSLQVRIELGQRLALVAVGVGEQEVAACRGAIDGVATGPAVGDLGDWHTTATTLRQSGGVGGGQSGGSDQSGGGGRGGQSGSSGGRASGQSGGGAGQPPRGTPTATATTEPDDCPAREERCGEACVNLQTDPSNCGACGEVCPGIGGLVCVNGGCGCPSGWTDCSRAPGAPEGIDGYCSDLQTDPANCGVCGTSCAEGENCEAGVCQGGACEDGLTDCGGVCVDTNDDPINCGACDKSCVSGVCQGGVCPLCAAGLADCGGICVDLMSDAINCGTCGLECGYTEQCSGGACQPRCAPGLSYCNGVCLDHQSDPAYCGGCGSTFACAAGQVCQGGVCILPCASGLQDCGGYCADLLSDPANCGACGIGCGGRACVSGICQLTCAAQGLADCGGVCVDLQSDHNNCGFCGNACFPGLCYSGVCTVCNDEIVAPGFCAPGANP